MTPSNAFTGFHKDTFQLFRDLAHPEKNNRLWFDANRSRYEENVVGKMRSLLATLKPFVRKLNPQFECRGKTNGNFSRINRDIRFSNDKSPYKLNYYLYFYDQRRSRDGDGRLYVGVSGEGLTVGFSIYGEWRRHTGDIVKDVLRKRARSEAAPLLDFLQKQWAARRYESYWYSRVGKEWTPHHGWPKSAEQWNQLLGWVVRRKIKPRDALLPQVLKEIQSVFQELYPLYIFSAWKGRRWALQFKTHSR